MYEDALDLQGIRPVILAEIDQSILSSFGISPWNIIHLRKGSVVWWNGPDAKRKRSNTSTSLGTEHGKSVGSLPRKKVAYEKKFHDSSGNRFSGPPMQADDGDSLSGTDYKLFYKCKARNQWLPVPKGFMVVEDEDTGNHPLAFSL